MRKSEEEQKHCEAVAAEVCFPEHNQVIHDHITVVVKRERAAAFSAGEKAQFERDQLEFRDKHNRTAAAESRAATITAAAKVLLAQWSDWTSQEMYGECLREGMHEEDFEAWDDAHRVLREAIEKKS